MRSIIESEAKSAGLIIIARIILPEIFLLCCRNSFHRYLQTLKILLAVGSVNLSGYFVGVNSRDIGFSASFFNFLIAIQYMFKEYSEKIRQWLKEEGCAKPIERSDDDLKLAFDITFGGDIMTIGFLKTQIDSVYVATKLPIPEDLQMSIKHLKTKEDLVLDLRRFLYNLHFSPEFTRDKQDETITQIYFQKIIYFDGLTKDRLFEVIYDISNSIEYIRQTLLRIGKP